MRQGLPVLLLLLAVGGVLWLLIGGETSRAPEAGLEVEESMVGESTPDDMEADAAADLEGGARKEPEGVDEPIEGELPEAPDLSVGGLTLRVTDRFGDLLDREGVSARILYVNRPDRPAIAGVAGEEGSLFGFRKLPLGAVRVHVGGDLVIAGMVNATIQGGVTARRTLAVKRAGALQYDVQYPDRSHPKEVRLSLVDEQGKPVSAWYRQHKQGEERARPQRGRTVRVPSEGVVYGLPEGTYTLKAVVVNGGKGAETAFVSLGGTALVIVPLER